MMIAELTKLYQDSLINAGRPASTFAPTEVFNEGWLLRAVLQEWKAGAHEKPARFLPFPGDAKVYSEGQLYTPFGARFRGDKHAESHTHADGIVGHFSFSDTKSGIVLDGSFTYFAVFEAKLSSPLAAGTSNAPGYDQVARTIGCMINMILQSGSPGGYAAHFVVLYPRNNSLIIPSRYAAEAIADQLARRIATYEGVADWRRATSRFARQWDHVLDRLQISFVTWEDALAQIANDELSQFYKLCLQFN
jgi:hypothetical protein